MENTSTILDMSKIESENLTPDLHSFHFEEMLDDVMSVVGLSINEKQLSLVVNLDKAIPRFIVSDKIRFAQVLRNLLSNAIKFTPEGGTVTLNVSLVLATKENHILVEVADTGIGIPKEQHARLLKDFAQIESNETHKFSGTGLGLLISKQIVEMLGGCIRVESKPGEGSRFIFTIPIQASDE